MNLYLTQRVFACHKKNYVEGNEDEIETEHDHEQEEHEEEGEEPALHESQLGSSKLA